MKKDYNTRPKLGGIGITMHAGFATHIRDCEQCRAADLATPRALADLCLEGSVLWKRENVVQEQKAPDPEQAKFRTTAANLRKIMRYKE